MRCVNEENVQCTPLIIGIDINPSSSPASKTPPKYAVTVLSGKEFIETNEKASLKELLALTRKYKPMYLAMDNIFEIFRNRREMFNLILKIPPETSIVQVTGSPVSGYSSLKYLARKYQIEFAKNSPIETAKTCAILASKGVGDLVIAFENETKIKISRARKLGPGGWSQGRLRRKLHTLILNATRNVEYKLNQAGFEYDLIVRRSDFGLDKSEFIVQRSVSDVLKVIKPYKGADFTIEVSPIRRRNIAFAPISGESCNLTARKSIIVGIDPGITTGIALIDFDGNILDIKSSKIISRSILIRYITDYGIPSVIATDVNPPSNFVVKIAKMLNARLYYPNKVLLVNEKHEIVQNFLKDKKIKVEDSHQRDALAAALKAYFSLKNIFDKVDSQVKDNKLRKLADRIKAEIVVKNRPIKSVIEDLKAREEEKEIEVEERKEEHKTEESEVIKRLKEKIAVQKTQIDRLKAFNESLIKTKLELKEENKLLKRKLDAELKENIRELKKLREIEIREKEINRLKKLLEEKDNQIKALEEKLEKLKKIKILEIKGEFIPIKYIEAFTQESINKTDEEYGIREGDIVFLADASGGGPSTAALLVDRKIKAVITATKMSHLAEEVFIEANIPVIPAEEVNLKHFEGFAVISRDMFISKYKQWKSYVESIKENITTKKIITLIKEYQRKRWKNY